MTIVTILISHLWWIILYFFFQTRSRFNCYRAVLFLTRKCKYVMPYLKYNACHIVLNFVICSSGCGKSIVDFSLKFFKLFVIRYSSCKLSKLKHSKHNYKSSIHNSIYCCWTIFFAGLHIAWIFGALKLIHFR